MFDRVWIMRVQCSFFFQAVDGIRYRNVTGVQTCALPICAKVRIFAELYRKTRQLEQLNQELELRIAERTAELEASHARLLASERCRSLPLEAGQMGDRKSVV